MAAKQSQNAGAGQSARAPRVNVRCDALLTEADGCELHVTIVDLSSDGFRLHSREELVEGEEVMLQVGKQRPLRARIMWIRGFEAGGRFLDPVEFGGI